MAKPIDNLEELFEQYRIESFNTYINYNRAIQEAIRRQISQYQSTGAQQQANIQVQLAQLQMQISQAYNQLVIPKIKVDPE